MSKLNNEAVRVKCTRPEPLPDGSMCEYEWSTRSSLLTISCPNCRYPNNKAKAIAAAKGTRTTGVKEMVSNGTPAAE